MAERINLLVEDQSENELLNAGTGDKPDQEARWSWPGTEGGVGILIARITLGPSQFVLDLKLPKVDGLEASHFARPENETIAVVFLRRPTRTGPVAVTTGARTATSQTGGILTNSQKRARTGMYGSFE